MKNIEYLYESRDSMKDVFKQVDIDKDCIVQIFTNSLSANEAVSLASYIKEELPLSKIIGSSVSGVIYKGEQFDNVTLICIEQYDDCFIDTAMISLINKTDRNISLDIVTQWKNFEPKLLRMFVGNYYDYAHQLIENLNHYLPNTEIVGGMSGELHQKKDIPFVFDDSIAMEDALVIAAISGENISLFHRINTSHTPVTEIYKITEVNDRVISSIEGIPAVKWLEQNIGILSTKHYNSWEDTAKHDPLVRFQIALENHPRAIRFVHFDEESGQISQYFSRLEAGTRFRISYTSPSKCVEEVRETANLVATTSMETMFCYSCLFRKLYLKNCAQWELTPYHNNPISGVFLLGEFGYDNGQNALLNGSCVLAGIGEKEHYLDVDTTVLKTLETIKDDKQGLLDFLKEKQNYTYTKENDLILDTIINNETVFNSLTLIQEKFGFNNMIQYELAREQGEFDKIALIKIENAEVLISYMGQNEFHQQVSSFLGQIRMSNLYLKAKQSITPYVLNNDTFIIAASQDISNQKFIDFINKLEDFCKELQVQMGSTPFLIRFIVVENNELLLEEAFSQLQLNKDSQKRLIVSSSNFDFARETRRELDSIKLIQYALANDTVIPYYQGIFNNKTGKIDKYEALMRLKDRDGNIHAPHVFMDLSKKYRLYLDLNLKMYEKVLRDFDGLDFGININLSAHDISSPKFRHKLEKSLSTFSKPENITFEIVEEDYISDMEGLLSFIEEIRSFGAKIAVDDFGSGYSNLFEIIKIRPDSIKIDGKIVKALDTNEDSEILINVIDSLGTKLGVDLVAEFVENQSIQNKLLRYNILHSQGYHFSKPKPFEEIKDLLL